MKKLVIDITGYHPFAMTDLGFIQDAYTEAINGLLSTYGVSPNEPVILSGCVKSFGLGNTLFSEGYVAIGGEVCFMPFQVIPTVVNDKYWFVKEQTFDPLGSLIFELTGPKETYEVTSAKIESGASVPVGLFDFDDAKTVYQYIRDGLSFVGWVTFDNADDDGFYGPGLTPPPAIRKYHKDVDGFVHLKGSKVVDDVTVATDILIGQLPVGFRPPDDLVFGYTNYISQAFAQFYRIRVGANGDINALQVTGNFSFNLHNLPLFRST